MNPEMDASPGFKKCPDCAEEVRVEARKCRFCGFMFTRSAEVEAAAEETVSPSKEPEEARSAEPKSRMKRALSAFSAGFSKGVADVRHEKADKAASMVASMVCPHCQSRGTVKTRPVKLKKGISGAKATGAILTGGLSILATGLSRKEDLTEATCSNCGSVWHF
jgi:hypothetical protein